MKTYKIWVHVEELDENEEGGDCCMPIFVCDAINQEQAEAIANGLIRSE